ncbi:MAG: Gfo/Idh/MocA family oxidoreductase [Verrucomicrobia bacterium]|nr:Gfo/Idh/MocA family oxidoreductase [Verrucomicrobiota bacterium]
MGRVYMIRATINTHIGAGQRIDLAKYRGGMMFELGAHLIDPVVRLLGRPNNVTPYLGRSGAHADGLADNTVAIFEYANAMAVVSSSTPQPNASSHRSFEVLGTNGTALVNPIEPPRLQIDLADASGPYLSGRHEVPMPNYRRYAPEFADLADAIQSSRTLAFEPDGDLLVHETLMRACDMDI